MRILFIVPHLKHYDGTTVRTGPSGGTEKAAVFLSEALRRLGQDVRLVTTWPAVDTLDEGWPEVVVTQHATLFERFGPDVFKIWWCHQASDRPFIREGAKYARRHAHQVVTLSGYHQQNFRSALAMESDVIGYGVWRDELAAPRPKVPGRMIFASVPQRGLEHVADLFREIRIREPSATIAICSSNATWGMPEADDPFRAIFAELESIPGVELLGSLPQAALYEQFAKASVFFYPCTYVETFCLAMSEAMAHGCVPVVTDLGALPDRWVPTRRLVGSAVAAIARTRQRPVHIPPQPDWIEIAEKWLALLE